jgi:ElaB/YqjD/DUF883 family membrane-anchored ribosome-binding protein
LLVDPSRTIDVSRNSNWSNTMSDANGSTLNGVTEKLGIVRDQVIVGVADAVNSTVEAARVAKDKASEGIDSLLDQGKDLVDDAGDVIRNRPWATVGIALATGYLIAKLTSRGR